MRIRGRMSAEIVSIGELRDENRALREKVREYEKRNIEQHREFEKRLKALEKPKAEVVDNE